MTPRIIILDDGWERFRPITKTRPLCELLFGTTTFRARLERLFPDAKVSVVSRPFVSEFFEMESGVPTGFPSKVVEPLLVVEPNVVFGLDFPKIVMDSDIGTAYTVDGEVVAALVGDVDSPLVLSETNYPKIEIGAKVVPSIWDLVNMNGEAICPDFENFFNPELRGEVHPNAVIYEKESVFIAENAEICANAVLDARSGPIIVAQNATVRPGVTIEGPCYIGKGTAAVSGWIRGGCSFGPICRIGGEVESSIFIGYSNKCHEGFVGHSFFGKWVNIGALTTTSDLKNNYGEIRLHQGDGEITTGRIKVGSFVGDHTKTGIGALLNSGTCLGVSVNHFGQGFAPKFVPDFSWGGAEGYVEYDIEKALSTARTVMSRRDCAMSSAEESLLRSIHAERQKNR